MIVVEKDIFENTQKNIGDLKKIGTTHFNLLKLTEINKIIFSAAAILKVGDIHIEPESRKCKDSFPNRRNPSKCGFCPVNEYPGILGEIKMLSGVKTEVRQGVIDSRFNIKFDEDIKEIAKKTLMCVFL